MSPIRTTAIPITVDVEGVEVAASLRPPRSSGDNYRVRYRLHGVRHEKSTGTNVLAEAKRMARRIICGEPMGSTRRSIQDGMTLKEFEQIQDAHFGLNDREEAGRKSKVVFYGVWRSFCAVCPIRTIQEVTDITALRYLNTLLQTSKTQNHNYKTKSAQPMSKGNVRKHIRTLAAAWNRVRRGHRAKKGGIPDGKAVDGNPWEEIRNNVPPAKRKEDPVQFELENGELERFLDKFAHRPVAELFLITSLWSAGRIQEMCCMEWGWLNGDYLDIPDVIAKRGRGKIVRVPPLIRQRLEEIRVPGCPYVFAAFAGEVERNLQSCHKVLAFSPKRMVERLEKYIKAAAEAIGRPQITHHAFRRTAMELSDEGELRAKEKSSAEKLQTTLSNKTRNYIKRKGKKAIAKADGLYENLTVSLQYYPALAERLGCEPVESRTESEMESLIERLTPIQKRRLQKKLLEDDDGDGQVVA